MALQNLNNPSAGGSGGGGLSSVTADTPLSGAGTSGSHLVIANASGAAVGVIQLGGDLGGTATVPTVTNASHITNGSLPASGIAAVNPSSLTGTGTVPIGGIPTGSSSSTVAIGNDSRLSDARTPTVHGTATHAPGGSDDLRLDGGRTKGNWIETNDRRNASQAITTVSGTIYFTHFTAGLTKTVGNLGVMTAAAGATLTKTRMGLYTISASGVQTLVAATAADASASITLNTFYNKPLAVAGDLSTTLTTYTITAGADYALAFICVGTTPPTLRGPAAVSGAHSSFSLPGLSYTPITSASLAAQADLTLTPAANQSGTMLWEVAY